MAQLANLPPDQRAMAEQMMRGQMQGMMGDSESAPPPRVEKKSRGAWQGRECTHYDVFENNIKIQEICSAPLDKVDGGVKVVGNHQNGRLALNLFD